MSFVRSRLGVTTNDLGTGQMLVLGKRHELRLSQPDGSLLGRVWFPTAQPQGAARERSLNQGREEDQQGLGRECLAEVEPLLSFLLSLF